MAGSSRWAERLAEAARGAAGSGRRLAQRLAASGWSRGDLGRHWRRVAAGARLDAQRLAHRGWGPRDATGEPAAARPVGLRLARLLAAGGWSRGDLGRHWRRVAAGARLDARRLARRDPGPRDASGGPATARWRPFGLRGWRVGAVVGAAALAVVVGVVGVLNAGPRPRLQPEAALPEVIGFYQNGWSQIFRSSFPSLRSHYRYINTVLAFWYSVDGSAHLHAHSPQPAVTAWVRSHHMRMGVLVNNIGGPAGNNAGMLRTSALRHQAARVIANLASRKGYQEVNIDFELLPPAARNDFTRFIADLRKTLPRTVVLSVSVFPKLGVPASLNGAYNYAALARSVNYLVIMLYDRHSSGGPAGPVSPYPWVVSNMNWFLKSAHIPASKLVLAAGVYGYDWTVGATHATELPLDAVVALAKREHASVQIDRASGNPYFRYTSSSGTAHIVWFQNNGTVAKRLRLARRLHLRGIAIWALGQETPAVWSAIEQTIVPRG